MQLANLLLTLHKLIPLVIVFFFQSIILFSLLLKLWLQLMVSSWTLNILKIISSPLVVFLQLFIFLCEMVNSSCKFSDFFLQFLHIIKGRTCKTSWGLLCLLRKGDSHLIIVFVEIRKIFVLFFKRPIDNTIRSWVFVDLVVGENCFSVLQETIYLSYLDDLLLLINLGSIIIRLVSAVVSYPWVIHYSLKRWSIFGINFDDLGYQILGKGWKIFRERYRQILYIDSRLFVYIIWVILSILWCKRTHSSR